MFFASNLGTAPRIAASRPCGEASARIRYRAQVVKRAAFWPTGLQEACSHNSNNNSCLAWSASPRRCRSSTRC